MAPVRCPSKSTGSLCSQHLPSPDPLLPFVFLIPSILFFFFASVSFFHGDIITLISAQFIRFLENGLPPPVPAPLIDSTWVFEHLPKHIFIDSSLILVDIGRNYSPAIRYQLLRPAFLFIPSFLDASATRPFNPTPQSLTWTPSNAIRSLR